MADGWSDRENPGAVGGGAPGGTSTGFDPSGPIGVIAALDGELGDLMDRAEVQRRVQGVRVGELALANRSILVAKAGVGKVAAAHATSVLLGRGVRTVLVVGTCGGLSPDFSVGDFVHAGKARQMDYSRAARVEASADERLRTLWQRATPGATARFLTADQPVMDPIRRRRLIRSFDELCVADMETAAIGAVAERAGCSWAALRVVSDTGGLLARRSFQKNFATVAARPADTIVHLLDTIANEHGAPAKG